MSLSELDLHIMACMYDENRIGKQHGNVERILNICVPKTCRDRHGFGPCKKRMKQLANAGYLILKPGRFVAYSLSRKGVIVAERWKSGWTLDKINNTHD